MATTAQNVYNPTALTKPVPGEAVITQTVITQQPAVAAAPVNKGYEIISGIFSVLAGVGMWLGSVLILTAMALTLRDSGRYYNDIGGLLVAGFALWFLASFTSWLGNFSGFAPSTFTGYHAFNFFFSTWFGWMGFALFLAGAACWLSEFENPRAAGEILWVIAGSLWLGSMLLRDMGVRYDTMNTYKKYPYQDPNIATDPNRTYKAAHISSIWSNALATDMYLVASVLFLIGSIMFLVRGRNFDINLYTSGQFQTAGAIMWLVGSCIVFFFSIAQCVSRR